MSSKSFKVKNGLTLTPKDLSTLVSPEAGDIACDLNDSNKIKRYDASTSSWVEVGSGGVGGVDIMFVQDFESAGLSTFDQVGLDLSQSSTLRGRVSAVLTHDASLDQYLKETVAVNPKFRGQAMVLRLDSKSSASQGNLVVKITDETSSIDLVASEQLQLSNDVNGKKTTIGFVIPESCESLSYTITALPEAGSPVSIIDDIICEIAETALLESVVELTGDAQTLTIPLTQSGLVQEGDSYIRLSGSTIDGSLRVTSPTVVTNIGNDFIVDTSAGYVKLKAAQEGVYTITFNADGTSSGLDRQAIIQLNGASLTNQRDIGNGAGEGFTLTNTTSRYLLTTDELTFLISGSSSRSYNIQASYKGSLKQVTINPESKITIPTSELRFEGASARGTTATGIVKFNTLTKLRGDAFTIVNTTELGTAITMKKDGIVSINSNIYFSTSNNSSYITLNQTTLNSPPLNDSEILSRAICVNSAQIIPMSWTGSVKVGDTIRISASATPNGATGGIQLNLSFQEQEISVAVTNTLPQFSESDSSVRVDTANGYGSIGTRTRRFSNVRENLGADVEYTDSSTDGATFTVKESGIYSISYTDSFSSANTFGIIKNGVSNTDPQSQNSENILALSATASANFLEACSWQGYLLIGDVIRAMASAGAAVGSSNKTSFTISKVGKPNVTGVDVTPFVNIPQPTITEWKDAGPIQIGAVTTPPTKGATSVDSVRYRQVGQDYEVEYTFRQTSVGSAGSGDYLVYLPSGIQFDSSQIFYTGTVGVVTNVAANSALIDSIGNITQNTTNTGYGTAIAYDSTRFRIQWDNLYSQRNTWNSVFFALVNTNISFKLNIKFKGKGLSATNNQLLTAPDTFSTDTASLSYKSSSEYTLSTLANAPVGTYITFTYAANTNTRAQTGATRPAQTDADMNVNGIRLFTRAYNATSLATEPACIAIQIGKGMKGVSLGLYKSSGKTMAGIIDNVIHPSGAAEFGFSIKDYDEKTGILVIDSGLTWSSATTNKSFYFQDLTSQASGYLVINAAKSPFMLGFGIANDAEARAGTVADKFVTPKTLHSGLNASGDAPIYAARAWVNFNGTGTVAIRGSGNVSSITDRGTGKYTVNLTTEMPDLDAAISASGGRYIDGTTLQPVQGPQVQLNTTSTVLVETGTDTTARTDWADIYIVLFR